MKIGDKYEIVGISPGKYDFNGFGVIDLRKLDVEQADLLYQKGFKYLKRITTQEPKRRGQ